ncbi:hypothetical protein tf_06 [Pseudomonas phage tf]|uniref:CR-type domain-containing protein n=1 Tax=Pseudomonas phage tf TaxID=1114179 RepID=I2FLM7_9CAUD|nr:hypothetical protein tf_06 [Pseudomonas phage tf]CCE60761.1 hypothetical protein tf_06 [Pseudomonas phage tf]
MYGAVAVNVAVLVCSTTGNALVRYPMGIPWSCKACRGIGKIHLGGKVLMICGICNGRGIVYT